MREIRSLPRDEYRFRHSSEVDNVAENEKVL